jgi:hypothetical protein
MIDMYRDVWFDYHVESLRRGHITSGEAHATVTDAPM